VTEPLHRIERTLRLQWHAGIDAAVQENSNLVACRQSLEGLTAGHVFPLELNWVSQSLIHGFSGEPTLRLCRDKARG
jgi:hypothetical protein